MLVEEWSRNHQERKLEVYTICMNKLISITLNNTYLLLTILFFEISSNSNHLHCRHFILDAFFCVSLQFLFSLFSNYIYLAVFTMPFFLFSTKIVSKNFFNKTNHLFLHRIFLYFHCMIYFFFITFLLKFYFYKLYKRFFF